MQTIQQTVQSHESAVKSVIEKGEALLDTVNDPTISKNMKRLQADYQDLCLVAKVCLNCLIIVYAIFIIFNKQTLRPQPTVCVLWGCTGLKLLLIT